MCCAKNYFGVHDYIDANGKCKWRVTLPPTKADTQTTYTITATSQQHGSIKISDILFGDVWVCSGQSNMGFNLKGVDYVLILIIESSMTYASFSVGLQFFC